MGQPVQVKTNLPDGSFVVVDNGMPGVTSTNNVAGAGGGSGNYTGPGAANGGGFDLCANGSNSQGINVFGDTGSVLLDSANDSVWPDPQCATFAGNPVSLTAPSFKTVSTIINDARTGIRILFKSPA